MTLRTAARAQIAYWGVTGAWPLMNMRGFERVTGRKRDRWLVRTVSLLILSVATTLLVMDRRGGEPVSARVLGATSTASLGAVSLIGPLVGRISPVYLVDAALEMLLLALWGRARDWD